MQFTEFLCASNSNCQEWCFCIYFCNDCIIDVEDPVQIKLRSSCNRCLTLLFQLERDLNVLYFKGKSSQPQKSDLWKWAWAIFTLSASNAILIRPFPNDLNIFFPLRAVQVLTVNRSNDTSHILSHVRVISNKEDVCICSLASSLPGPTKTVINVTYCNNKKQARFYSHPVSLDDTLRGSCHTKTLGGSSTPL